MKPYIYPRYHFANRKAFRWITVVLLFMVYAYNFVHREYGFSYTDEIVMGLLFLCWTLKARHKSKEFRLVLCVFAFYLANSFIDPHNVRDAILMDFVQQLKPFAAFYCVYDLGVCLDARYRRRLRRLCVLLTISMLPAGLANIGGGGR